MERVFTQEERRMIVQSENPELTLWMFWSAKECAYKIAVKEWGGVAFAHKRFQVESYRAEPASMPQKWRLLVGYEESPEAARSSEISGSIGVKYMVNPDVEQQGRSQTFSVLVTTTDQYVHAIGGLSTGFDPMSIDGCYWRLVNVSTVLGEVKRASRRQQSYLVRRYFLSHLAEQTGIEKNRIAVRRLRRNEKMAPPQVWIDGRQTNIGLSFSHHGRYIAWFYFLPVKFRNFYFYS